MLSKRSIKIIGIMFLLIILGTAIKLAIDNYSDFINELQPLLNEKNLLLVVGKIIVFVVLCFLDALLDNFILVIVYIVIKVAIRNNYKEKLNDHDFNKSQNYYREILKEYSPGVLNYIDNFKINTNTLVATLMHLKLNKYIEIKDGNLNIINYDYEGLVSNEKHVMKSISEKQLKNFDYDEFEKCCRQDSFSQKLIDLKEQINLEDKSQEEIRQRKLVKKRRIKIVLIILILVFFVAKGLVLIQNNQLENTGLLIASIFAFMGIIFLFPILSFYFRVKTFLKDPYVRNKSGIEINSKLEGLKNYIKSFGNLSQSSQDQMTLWEDYLIYSVIFNINTRIVEEYTSIINCN